MSERTDHHAEFSYVAVGPGGQRLAGAAVAVSEDDIAYPPAPLNPSGRLMVTVKHMAAEDISYTLDPPGYTVRLYYSDNGAQAFPDDPVAPFVFDNVPQGVHAVVVLRMKWDPPQPVVQDTIQIFGKGATGLVELTFRL
jgi:hypothetical protein